MAEKKDIEPTAPVHTKAQILAATKYNGKKDMINALLADNETYTTKQVDALIEKFLKGKVI